MTMASKRLPAKDPAVTGDDSANCWYIVMPGALQGPLLLSNKMDVQQISNVFWVGVKYERFTNLKGAVDRFSNIVALNQQWQQQQAATKMTPSGHNKRKLPAPAAPLTTVGKRPKTANAVATSRSTPLMMSSAESGETPPVTKIKEQLKCEHFHQLFDRKIKQLAQFKEEYGDTDVPYNPKSTNSTQTTATGKILDANDKRFSGLGYWCSTIRTQLRVYQASKEASKLTSAEVTRLREIGFCMEPARGCNSVWKEGQYNRLVKFYQQHGHTKVPGDKSNCNLRAWLNSIRDAYQQQEKGQPTSLSDDQVEKLNEIGFCFDVNKRKSFDERATEWLVYKATNGGDEPPHNHSLRKWVLHTRKKYADYMQANGQSTILTQAQINKLTKWGFEWGDPFAAVHPRTKPKTFDERMEELRQYKAKFGDCLVPQIYPSLGAWVSGQVRIQNRKPTSVGFWTSCKAAH